VLAILSFVAGASNSDGLRAVVAVATTSVTTTVSGKGNGEGIGGEEGSGDDGSEGLHVEYDLWVDMVLSGTSVY